MPSCVEKEYFLFQKTNNRGAQRSQAIYLTFEKTKALVQRVWKANNRGAKVTVKKIKTKHENSVYNFLYFDVRIL